MLSYRLFSHLFYDGITSLQHISTKILPVRQCPYWNGIADEVIQPPPFGVKSGYFYERGNISFVSVPETPFYALKYPEPLKALKGGGVEGWMGLGHLLQYLYPPRTGSFPVGNSSVNHIYRFKTRLIQL